MALLPDCHVRLSDGQTHSGVDVMFMDSGWVRVTDGDSYVYYPNHRVERVSRSTPGGIE